MNKIAFFKEYTEGMAKVAFEFFSPGGSDIENEYRSRVLPSKVTGGLAGGLGGAALGARAGLSLLPSEWTFGGMFQGDEHVMAAALGAVLGGGAGALAGTHLGGAIAGQKLENFKRLYALKKLQKQGLA